jgi:predicted transcriptional regulator
MKGELAEITKRLTAAFVAAPGATRAALAEALPEAIRSLAAIATGKEYKASARMKAIDELLKLQRRIVAEDLARATVAVRRREAEVKAIEAQVSKIRAKTEQDVESRRKRKAVQKALRTIAAAKKVGQDAA